MAYQVWIQLPIYVEYLKRSSPILTLKTIKITKDYDTDSALGQSTRTALQLHIVCTRFSFPLHIHTNQRTHTQIHIHIHIHMYMYTDGG